MNRRKRERESLRKRISRTSSHDVTPTEEILPAGYFSDINLNCILHGSIDIQILDFITSVLKTQFNVSQGMLPPSYIYAKVLESEELPPTFIIKNCQDAVQIHYCNGHFVVSAQSQSTVTVYDSIRYNGRVEHLYNQLGILYEGVRSGTCRIDYQVPQSQGASLDCGVFAAANALSLIQGNHPPSNLSQTQMRRHLYDSLKSGHITDFPREHTGIQWYSNYLTDQRKKKTQHAEKKRMNLLTTADVCETKLKSKRKDTQWKEKMGIQRKSICESEKNILKQKDTTKKATAKHYINQYINEGEKNILRQKQRIWKENQRKRQSKSEKKVRKQKDKERKEIQRKRTLESDKNMLKQKDKVRKEIQRKRLSESENNILKQKDKVRKEIKKKRTLESDENILKQKDKERKKIQRKGLSGSERNIFNKNDRNRKEIQRKRTSESEKNIQKQIQRMTKRTRRNNVCLTEKLNLQQTDRRRKVLNRKQRTESEVQNQKEKNAIKQQANRTAKRIKLRESPSVTDVLQTFFTSITNGPTFECYYCHRLMYSTSVQTHNSNWICKTCKKSVQKGQVPAQAYTNNLQPDKVPEQLKVLCHLESQLICKIIPFMKIVCLPKGSQRGLKGQVVLVPSNIDKTASALPRLTSEAQIIALNLKRRLTDDYPYSTQFIRPYYVNEALHLLHSENPHYSTVKLNNVWVDQNNTADNDLWKVVSEETALYYVDSEKQLETSEADINDCENTSAQEQNTKDNQPQHQTPQKDDTYPSDSEIVDSEDDIDKENPPSVVEEMNLKRSLNSVTCMYPENGPSVKSNQILNIAPAEGQTPTSIFYQDHWETMAFPTLFPSGKNTFHEKRTITLTPKKYVNARLLCADGRFAESAEYTFQCLHWIESTDVNNTITMSLKKSRQGNVSVGQLQDPDRIRNMMKDEEIFTSFKKLRGSPQYWKDMQQDMLAKIRQFGTYTFFVTGSAADFHWPELIQIVAKQYGEHLELSYIEHEMDMKTKRQWLARNPVTIARHIDYIFHKLWKNVILSGLHPIGQILNYDIRKEMQSRGTAHFHSAVHVQNAPVLDKDTDEKVIEFIDRYISCEHPTEDEELATLVSSRQTRHHTRTCKKKKGLNCRFHFPKPPTARTIIARTLCDNDNAKERIKYAQDILSRVMNIMAEAGTDITLNELLKRAEVSPEHYEEILQIALKKTTIILRRKPTEMCINPYNPIILKALRANMDIQYISDVWACIAYITSYMCKPERTMSDLMRNACKEANTTKQKLKSIGNVFVKSREVSQHEAIARLLGLPLKETNIPVRFIPTGYPEERTRMVKSPSLLKKMENDDTDVYHPNIIDKYAARPSTLEQLCLAAFASNYESTSRYKNQEDEEKTDKEVSSVPERKIHLRNELGIMVKRRNPVVLRFYSVSVQKDSEKYFFRLLLLYLPWRDEAELDDCTSYENKFEKVKELITSNIENCEPFLQEVEEAQKALENINNTEEEIWDQVAPQAEQDRSEEAVDDPDNQFDADILTHDQLQQEDDQDAESNNRTQKNLLLTTNLTLTDNTKYYAMVRSLNEKQRQVHDEIFRWCRSITLASAPQEEPNPFYIFLSGGAGVGKSHTIHTIYQTVLRELRRPGDSPDTPSVILTAPTGKAAVNIGGNTLHSAFHLPVKQKRSRLGYHKPSLNTLNTMRITYCQMKILIIDEVSMVGAQTFSNIDLTLQDIFENDKPFGGISVLVVGDLLQLNPVGETPVFKGNSNGYHALATNLWHLFLLHELTDIVRQKDDPQFAQLLSRIREGKHTDKDIEDIKLLEENNIVPHDSVSIFLTNNLKDQYNIKQLDSLHTEVYTIPAKDSTKDVQTGQASVSVSSSNPHETGGLASEIKVAVNARYMHSKNTDIEDRLVNGTTGTIAKLEIDMSKPLKGTIYVKFDDPIVGRQARKKSKFKDLVPIKAVTARFIVTEKAKSIQMERTQYPGSLAWGITVHKSQGSTFQTMIADMETHGNKLATMPGQLYTMLSRAKNRKGLKVCAFHPSKIRVNKSALEEMERLTKVNHFTFEELNTCNKFNIAFLNVRSLKTHYEDLLKDTFISSSSLSVLCLVETNVKCYKNYQLNGKVCVSHPTKHGCAIYCSLPVKKVLQYNIQDIETVGIITNSTVIVCVYVPPASSWTKLSPRISELINLCKCEANLLNCNNIIIGGDFNLDFKKLQNLQTVQHLQQLVRSPTHRLGGILDLVLSSKSQPLRNIPVFFSDHHLLITETDG